MFYLSQIKFLLFRYGPNGETKQFLFFPPVIKFHSLMPLLLRFGNSW